MRGAHNGCGSLNFLNYQALGQAYKDQPIAEDNKGPAKKNKQLKNDIQTTRF